MEVATLGISVVIRTRDMEKYLEALLQSLAQQTMQASEIIVVDNYSSESQLLALKESLREIARRVFKVSETRLKLVTLPDREFSHAYSTNLGANAAESELVCITNAHSLPISCSWLYDGAKHFEDGSVAGVSGFFFPHNDGMVTGRLDRLLYYSSQRAISSRDWFCTMTSIIRKELWKVYPFDENLPSVVPETAKYGLEDYDWGREMTARGYRIITDPKFSVFHSHTRGVDEIARNLKNYFIYKRIQRKINSFHRPRRSFTKVSDMSFASEILL